jgi:hypothetical protein
MNPRRHWLKGLAAGGLSLTMARLMAADPASLPAGVRKFKGQVLINGAAAQLGQLVQAGDTVVTGSGAEAVYVMGKDAYLLRGESTVVYSGEGPLVSSLRLISGKMLAVFGSGNKRIETPSATMGIRGTGCYIESAPDKVYFCLCYGAAELVPVTDPSQARVFETRYHDTPFYIDLKSAYALIRPAPVFNHRDYELVMLEALVGRQPPFPQKTGGSGY